ncbi:MAG: hypothetical protein WAO19_03420, partial [Candidatus Kryptoniota bacterium]
MTVLILYSSRYVCASIAYYLSSAKNVEVVCISSGAIDVMSLITEKHPGVVVVDALLMKDKESDLLSDIKRLE